jgi:hypothetical protein
LEDARYKLYNLKDNLIGIRAEALDKEAKRLSVLQQVKESSTYNTREIVWGLSNKELQLTAILYGRIVICSDEFFLKLLHR